MRAALLLALLATTPALAQDVEAEIGALEMDFADEMATRTRKASKVMRLEAAAAAAETWEAPNLWEQTRYATRDLFSTTEAMVDTAREIQALALTLPASTHGHLHARAAGLVGRTADLAADGVTQVVCSDLRTAAAFRSNGDISSADQRWSQALGFLEGERAWLRTPDQVDDFYDQALLTSLEVSERRAGRDLGRRCLARCTRPSARSTAAAGVDTWAADARLQGRRIHDLGRSVMASQPGTAEALSAMSQVDTLLLHADAEERRYLTTVVLVGPLRLTAAGLAGGTRDLDLLDSAWAQAEQVRTAPAHPRVEAESRRVQRRLERVPLAWAAARVGAPTRLDGDWRQPAGLGIAMLPLSWLKLEALGTWEIPVTGDLWTARLEGRVGVVPGADPAWEWTRTALRPVVGGGLVWGPGGQTGWSASGGLQLERVRRSWRSNSRVRVVGLEAAWTLTRLGERSWSGPTVAVYLGRGAVPWTSPGPRDR